MGPMFERHPVFPARINTHFVEVCRLSFGPATASATRPGLRWGLPLYKPASCPFLSLLSRLDPLTPDLQGWLSTLAVEQARHDKLSGGVCHGCDIAPPSCSRSALLRKLYRLSGQIICYIPQLAPHNSGLVR